MAEKPWNSKCPNCCDNRAYEGFQTIECPSYGCKYYTIKQANLVVEYKIALENEIALHLPELDDTVANKDAVVENYDDPYGFIQLP